MSTDSKETKIQPTVPPSAVASAQSSTSPTATTGVAVAPLPPDDTKPRLSVAPNTGYVPVTPSVEAMTVQKGEKKGTIREDSLQGDAYLERGFRR